MSSPTRNVLQNVNENPPILNKQDSDILHSIVEKLLWVANKGRPDIDMEILFLFWINQEHYGGQMKIKARPVIYETNNNYGIGKLQSIMYMG